MTIHLPKDVESSINAQVLGGLFASPDEAIAEAWREFIERRHAPATPPSASQPEVAPVNKPIWEKFEDIAATIPKEVWNKIPADSSEQLDHYLYGSPRRPPR